MGSNLLNQSMLLNLVYGMHHDDMLISLQLVIKNEGGKSQLVHVRRLTVCDPAAHEPSRRPFWTSYSVR